MATPNQASHWDAIVVGGGSAGLSASLTLGRARRKTLVFDTGMPRNRFASHMHAVLGNEGTDPLELLAKGRSECERYGIEFTAQEVTSVRELPETPDGGPLLLEVAASDGSTHLTRALIGASGLRDELPPVPGLSERWGKTVAHCPYCHGFEFADQRIGVLGFGPAGLHHAEMLRQWTDQLTLFSGGMGELDLDQVLRLESCGIRIEPAPVHALKGDPAGPIEVELATGETQTVDAAFTFGHLVPNDGYLEQLSLERTEVPFGGNFIKADAQGQTSNSRIWLAGNVCQPSANVPMSIAVGNVAAAACNMALITEDFDLALKQ
ncbi:NAD(P)/FAD-dependent oxidoreductase [Corynebacterium lubricantis]|uniref:NAD(P)/FAD-dependent oxidoreductase n=1 Tax=Corynebacterium lubricantis TaxID=541095 RepID=UPI000377AEBC|nr:NAD(P)/FAD-dependent oxidoreductase [Corynebacterium lubricantis]